MKKDLYKKQQEKIKTGEKSEILKFGEGKGYFTLSHDGSKITYNAQGYTDNYNDPEEQVRADFYIDLIEKYKYYPAKDIIEIEK